MKALVPRHTKMVALAGVDDCDTPGDIDAARSALGPGPARNIDPDKPHRTADVGARRPYDNAAGGRRPERGFDSNRGADGRTAGSGTAGIGVPGVLAADDTGAADEPAATAAGAPVPVVIAPSVTDTRNLHGADVRAAAAGPPLPLDQARRVLGETLTRLPERHCELNAARGAALATSINALGALPRFDVSAMDGYAVRGAGPWQLRADIGFAGGQRPDGLHPGEAVRIATGAQVPEGTTGVLRDEFARYDGRLHRLPDTPERSDIRRRGEDRTPGDTIAPAGSAVTAALVSAAAAVEVTTATVRGPVRARIVMTGDEIRSTGPLQSGQTRDSIGPILPVLLAAHGVQTLDQVHLRDTSHGFDQVLATATDCDLLVVVGATGGGAADQLRGALDRARARILVPRLALRPGGSTVAAELPSATTVLGLPGNPFAAVVTLLALIPAVVAGRTGAHPPRPLIGPLHNATEIAGPVTRIVPARIATDPAGAWIGDTTVRTAHLGGLVDRDGVVVVPADASDGTPVEFIPVPH
ncbi:molybdenum cofactor biosynthesis protein [Nocardia speluncae]|uniref:Molybdopterin molybdenumtransferase n=2 Tax=Nocardia speluncae TaxID=419477 RepID=A0A846XDF3_9NOCA|nr:molybdenum cofactor biosynthesis protein [Nocardia speluncae]